MSLILRQSTSKAVSFGPFLDKTDGVTLEVGLVTAIDHATTGIFLSKNGGALAIRSQAVTASTYDAYGNYIVTLSTTDTNTIGTLRMQFSEAATCLPVWQDFIVVDELVYDVLFGTVAPATTTNITAGTITTATNVTTVNGLAANVITAASMNADASAEIADAVWDEDATAHQTLGTFGQAIGDPGADTTTIYQSVVTDAAGTNIAADIIAIEAQTDDIGAAGAGLTAVPWNASWAPEVESEVNDALVVHRLDELMNADSDIDGLAPPTVGSVFHELLTKTAGSFTYDQTTDSLEAVRDWGDAAWITATGFATPTNITAGTITTVTNLTNAPTSGDLTATMKASVNTEVLDVLNTDTFAEPGQGTPAATASIVQKIGYLFKAWRNRTTQTATQYSVYNDDAVTIDHKATFSDDATTADRGEVATGP